MKWRRLLVRVTLGLLGALVLLTVAGYLLSFTGLYQAWARDLVLGSLEDSLRVKATARGVGGNPIYRVALDDLVLTSQGRPVLSAERASISYFLPQVILATPVIGVALDKFDLNVVRTPRGLNLTNLAKPSQGPPSEVVVSGVSLQEGRVTYTDATGPQAGPPTVIEDLNVEGGLSLPASPGKPVVIRLRQASFKVRRPELTVTGATGTLSHGPQGTSLELEAKAQAQGDEFEGKLAAEGSGQDLKQARAKGRLELERFKLARFRDLEGAGRLDFSLAGDTLTVSRGEIETPAASTTFSGQVARVSELPRGGLSAAAQGRLKVSDLGRLSGRPDLKGATDLTYDLKAAKGPGQDLKLDFSAQAARTTIGGLRLESGRARGSWQPSLLRLESLTARLPEIDRLSVAGTYEPDKSLDLTYQASTNDIGPLASRLGAGKIVTGSLTTAGRLSGPPASPQVRGSFSGRGLSYGASSAQQAGGGYQVSDLRGEARGSVSASLSGLQFQERTISAASLSATLPRQGELDFRARLQQDPQTSYLAQGSASGLNGPTQTLQLATFEATTGGLTVHNTAPLPVIISRGQARLPRFTLASPDSSFTASGSATVPGPVAVSLHFSRADLGPLSRLIWTNFPVNGRLSGPVEIEGTTDAPRIRADLRAEGGTISAVPFQNLTANIRYAPELAVVEGRLTLPTGQDLPLSGSVPVKVTLMPPNVSASSGLGLFQAVGREVIPRVLEELFQGLGRGGPS